MSKKTLLNENAIRRFMKLASIEKLTENFVDNNTTKIEEEATEADELKETSDEELKETSDELEEGGMMYARDDDEMEMDDEGEMEMGDEELDMGDEDLPEEPPVDAGEGLTQNEIEDKVEQLATMFLDNVREVFGVEGEVTTTDEEPMGDLEGPGDELDMDMEPEMEPEMEMEPEEELEEGSGDRNDPRNEAGNQRQREGSAGNPGKYLEEEAYQELINNIASRVSERLAELKKVKEEQTQQVEKENKIEALADKLVEQIFSVAKENK